MKPSAIWPDQTRTPLVVAAARPAQPNSAVIRAAADLANACDAELLVISMMRFFVPDSSDVPYTECAVLESYEDTLFGHCAELLAGDPVRWSVHVTSQPIESTVNELAARRRVVGLVLGSRRRGGWLNRLRRRLRASPAGNVLSAHTLVIESQ